MLKANAYGHGILKTAKLLEGKCNYFGVASIEEGILLRENNITTKIIVFSGLFHCMQVNDILKHKLIPIIFNIKQFEILKENKLFFKDTNTEVWVKVNSGMNRLGLNKNDLNYVYNNLTKYTTNINVMTHFSESESSKQTFTSTQLKIFHDMLFNKNFNNVSSFNSGACISSLVKDNLSNTIRVGLSLYGISTVHKKNRVLEIKPAMSVYSKVISINKVDKNNFIGYNRRYQTNDVKDIAIVSFGYGDGYPQFAPDGVEVLIKKEKYPIVGKISMDMLAVDITKSKDINIGDIVTLFDDKELLLENVASSINISPYYMLTSITNRVKRHV